MNWISIKDKTPNIDTYVLMFRVSYPSFYWMGKYKHYSINDPTDEPEYWMEIPKPPME